MIEKAVSDCARCGGDHANIVYRNFARPVPDVDGDFTHWGTCPTTGDPILMRVMRDGEKRYPGGRILLCAYRMREHEWEHIVGAEIVQMIAAGRLCPVGADIGEDGTPWAHFAVTA